MLSEALKEIAKDYVEGTIQKLSLSSAQQKEAIEAKIDKAVLDNKPGTLFKVLEEYKAFWRSFK